jgi:hypothetical protein
MTCWVYAEFGWQPSFWREGRCLLDPAMKICDAQIVGTVDRKMTGLIPDRKAPARTPKPTQRRKNGSQKVQSQEAPREESPRQEGASEEGSSKEGDHCQGGKAEGKEAGAEEGRQARR